MSGKTTYNKEIAEDICYVLSTSPYGLPKLKKTHNYWPSIDTIYHWRNTIPEFEEMYEKARKCQADILVEQNNDIAHSEYSSMVEIHNARLKIEDNRWQVARLKPRKWGDKTTITVSDEDDSLDVLRKIIHGMNEDK